LVKLKLQKLSTATYVNIMILGIKGRLFYHKKDMKYMAQNWGKYL